jgi:very-short-patch-repair endonuclease
MTTGRPVFPTPSQSKRAFAKALRAAPTNAERRLWRGLKQSLPLAGTHFRRQAPLGPYIADFCCFASKLVIEVDGEQHGFDQGRSYDVLRDQFLSDQGFRILRFSNHDVMTALDAVLETIFAALNRQAELFGATPTPNPSPQGGGEFARLEIV